jgi:hypothetical protein
MTIGLQQAKPVIKPVMINPVSILYNLVTSIIFAFSKKIYVLFLLVHDLPFDIEQAPLFP